MAYKLVSEFKGYVNKRDKTNLPPGFLIAGSKNVISTDGDLVATRPGYSLYGAANTALTPIEASFEWTTNTGVERSLRAYDDELEVDISGTWTRILDSWASVAFQFTTYWDTNEGIDVLLFVNGDDNVYSWTGGLAVLSSATTNSITKTGTATWAEARFVINGSDYDKKVVINGTTYTYTGGENTTTLTGVTPDPSGEAVNSNVIQKPTTHPVVTTQVSITGTTIAFVNSNPDTITDSSNGFVTAGFAAGDEITVSGTVSNNGTYTIASVTASTITLKASDSLTVESAGSSFTIKKSGFGANLISTLGNQVYYGSTTSNQIFVSKVDDFNNFTTSSPRAVGEGVLLTLDSATTAFVPQEEFMYISAGKSDWYQTALKLSSDNTDESLIVEKLKSGVSQSAKAQSMVSNIKNYVMFITNEPTLDQLGRLENIENPQSKPLSDPIKTDFDSYDFTNAHIKFFKNNVYIAVPQQSLLLIYNLSKNFWEAPQVLPAGRLAIIDNELYLHSNSVPETYKLSYGLPVDEKVYNDNGFAMEAIARFSYMNYGQRAVKKSYTDYFVEFYLSSNTQLTRKDFFEYQGVEGTQTEIYNGTDQWALFDTGGGGIGKENLGKSKLAGNADTTNLKKYRKVDTSQEFDFYEMFTQFSSNGIDQQWALLSFGPDIELSTNENFSISS